MCLYNDIEKKIFSVRVINCWNRLSSKAIDAPFQSRFNIHLDIILIEVNLKVIRQLNLMIFEGPFRLTYPTLLQKIAVKKDHIFPPVIHKPQYYKPIPLI